MHLTTNISSFLWHCLLAQAAKLEANRSDLSAGVIHKLLKFIRDKKATVAGVSALYNRKASGKTSDLGVDGLQHRKSSVLSDENRIRRLQWAELTFSVSTAGLGDPGGCGEKHAECGAGGVPAAARSQSLSRGVWRTQVSTADPLNLTSTTAGRL